MKKILVTGGAGFIGSHLVKRLVNQGHSVTIIDNLERGKIEFISDIIANIEMVNADLTDYDLCNKYFTGKDIVIHLASKVGGIGTYLSKPYEVMNANIKMDINVLRCVVENKINKYFYASSAHIYPKELQTTTDSPMIKESEAYPANPELSYGWAKLIGEKLIESAILENKWLKASIGRFIGIYGPNQDFNLDTGSVIPVFSHRAIKYPQVPFKILGDGKETRSYCYIDDAIDCILKIIEQMDHKNVFGPFNIGKNERNTIEEIAKIIIEISGKDIRIEYEKNKKTLIMGQFCDVSKIKDEINWEAETSLKDGIKNAYLNISKKINNQ